MTSALDRLSRCIGHPWQEMPSDEMTAVLDALATSDTEASHEVETALIEELSRRATQ